MHIGIGAAILILGLIYFAITSRGFRIILFWAIGITIGGLLLLLLGRVLINPVLARLSECPLRSECD